MRLYLFFLLIGFLVGALGWLLGNSCFILLFLKHHLACNFLIKIRSPSVLILYKLSACREHIPTLVSRFSCRYFLVCDSNQTCFVLSVYGMRNEAVRVGCLTISFFIPSMRGDPLPSYKPFFDMKFGKIAKKIHCFLLVPLMHFTSSLINNWTFWLQIKEGDLLTLLEPYYRLVDFSWKGKVWSLSSFNYGCLNVRAHKTVQETNNSLALCIDLPPRMMMIRFLTFSFYFL